MPIGVETGIFSTSSFFTLLLSPVRYSSVLCCVVLCLSGIGPSSSTEIVLGTSQTAADDREINETNQPMKQ
jgi:hypothetical protein